MALMKTIEEFSDGLKCGMAKMYTSWSAILYVDDLLITRPNVQEFADFKADLSKTFEPTDLSNSAFNLLLLTDAFF